MKSLLTIPLLLAAALCPLGGCDRPGGGPDPARGAQPDEAGAAPAAVRVAKPGRADVEDFVETQATLESDRRADIHAEVEGRIVRRHCDLGARVGGGEGGAGALLLAEIDDREAKLAVREKSIQLREKEGRTRELELEGRRADRELEQANVALEESQAALARTTAGIRDGTISAEEHEKATFARDLARTRVAAAQAALDKAKVALELGSVAVEQARVALERAELSLQKTVLRAPFPGVVTFCACREGERVRTGDLLYRIEDTTTLVVYGDLPVKQATRVHAGDPVVLASSAVPATTTGEVVLVAPTVDREAGTVRVKVAVRPAEGYRPGLFVTLRIVVERRERALVVPKRCVLHDDRDGAYVFVVRGDRAARTLVRTGFEQDARVEILEGIAEADRVVVEGQDTLTDGARVEIGEG